MTAGPTREMLDPVRFITNLSTGEMGYSVAREARRKGFQVTLISGPTSLTPPRGVRWVPIVTVKDLEAALKKHFFNHDVLFMSAAVGDFLPVTRSSRKVPRKKTLKVLFRQSPDLVGTLARRKGDRIVIGFSLETNDWLRRSRKKRLKKHLDGIVANHFRPGHNPFGKTRARVALIDSEGARVFRFGSKPALARTLIRWAAGLAGRSKN